MNKNKVKIVHGKLQRKGNYCRNLRHKIDFFSLAKKNIIMNINCIFLKILKSKSIKPRNVSIYTNKNNRRNCNRVYISFISSCPRRTIKKNNIQWDDKMNSAKISETILYPSSRFQISWTNNLMWFLTVLCNNNKI